MMDLYEAIEVVERVIDRYEASLLPIFVLDDDESEAIKICLEAAKDKASV